MHPAFSVLFFTVTSGFGYGFMFCLIVAQSSGAIRFEPNDFLFYSAVAFVLFTLGLLSSTFHLANPKNAWRSFTRFRTSWLSREGVFAIIAYPILASYVALVYFGVFNYLSYLLAVISFTLIVALLYCTAMIYASLKTIPQWNKSIVPPAFMIFGLCSGLFCLGLATNWQSTELIWITLVVTAIGLVVKVSYFNGLGQASGSSINTATSFSQAKVTLFDSGHSGENFLQREFIYTVGPKTTTLARRISLLLTFIIPILLLLLVEQQLLENTMALVSWAMVASLYIGLIIERWLFFVEAKHVVRHYYDKG